ILIISQLSVISAEKASSLLHFKCPYGNSDCLVKMYDLLIKDLSDGKPEYNIPPLDPVYIKKFNIRTNFLGPFNVHVVYENAKFSGVKNTTTKKF
uniref:Uncharacterized protein n=2 Tax=Phlebotomus papatasi TaxID=29031 RepID=A0A1B0DG84_PHLPP